MSKLPLVMLMGNRGAGKGSIAEHLRDSLGYVPRGFADPLYESLSTLNPWIRVDHGMFSRYNSLVAEHGVDYVKRNYPEVRTYLQLLGTECGRHVFGTQCWLKIAEKRSRNDRYTVFFDVRFPNEVAWGRTQLSLFIHVTSDREEPQGTHVSEYSIDAAKESDYTIENNGTLSELHTKVDKVLDDWQANYFNSL